MGYGWPSPTVPYLWNLFLKIGFYFIRLSYYYFENINAKEDTFVMESSHYYFLHCSILARLIFVKSCSLLFLFVLGRRHRKSTRGAPLAFLPLVAVNAKTPLTGRGLLTHTPARLIGRQLSTQPDTKVGVQAIALAPDVDKGTCRTCARVPSAVAPMPPSNIGMVGRRNLRALPVVGLAVAVEARRVRLGPATLA